MASVNASTDLYSLLQTCLVNGIDGCQYLKALLVALPNAKTVEDFEALLACRNHVGLLSEDLNPRTGELWGNFPQTYSMVGIINCAVRLSAPWDHSV